jgi:pyruvate dehydrogenase E2 component (dihydrolipoamide acetyltransferase)
VAALQQQRVAQPSISSVGVIPSPQTPTTTAGTQVVDFSRWGPITRKKMSKLRQAISRKMVQSWTSVPHVTQFDEADISGVMKIRKKHAAEFEKQGARLTITPFLLKALVVVLKKYPIFNASLDPTSNEIVYKGYYHFGIAIDTEQGLIVPVLRDVDKKSMMDLSRELQQLAERARQRTIGMEEMQGGTFTISNQGSIGGSHFTPIINIPEVAILGVGRGRVQMISQEGKTENRTMLPLTLSYDHRVIDGGDAARFISSLSEQLGGFDEADIK